MWTDLQRANKFDDVECEDREDWGILKPNDHYRRNQRLTNLCSNSAFGMIGIQPTTSATTQAVSCVSSFVSLLVMTVIKKLTRRPLLCM